MAKQTRRGGTIIDRGKDSKGVRTWLVRMFTGTEAGKRQYEARTVKGTKEDAQDALEDIRKGKKRGTVGASKLTVGELLDDVLRDYRINGRDMRIAELV